VHVACLSSLREAGKFENSFFVLRTIGTNLSD
jgi:hypothetical protein